MIFQHDCERCVFLGSWVDPVKLDEKFDLYWCMQSGNVPTLVARYGDDGPDYISGLCFKDTNRAIAEAYRRAIAKGLTVAASLGVSQGSSSGTTGAKAP